MASDETTVYVGGAIDPETGMTMVRLRLGEAEQEGGQVFLMPEATMVLARTLGQWAGFATEANRHVAMGDGIGALCSMIPEGSA